MPVTRLGRVLAIAGLLAGCGDPPMGDPDLGSRELPDGFVLEGCTSRLDCDDGNPCTEDRCEPGSKICSNTLKSCEALSDACNVGVCDRKDGECEPEPANDHMPCTTTGADPGKCMMGVCSPIPQCPLDFRLLDCSSFNNSTAGATAGASAVDAYACAGASGLTGPEYSYPFRVVTDRDVTLTLTGTTADLDLVVLEGTACAASATCVAAALTSGSGAEALTFRAIGGKSYVLVVDGRSGDSGSFTLEIACTGGSCKPIQTLACNQSVMGDTTGTNATNLMSSYACNASTPGPEDTYLVAPAITTNYKTTLKGMSTDLDLMITLDAGGECDPTWCKASAIQTGTTSEEVSWTGYAGSIYHMMVDSKMAGQGGPYLLEVACPPSCVNSSNTLSCSSRSDARRNDDATRSVDVIDGWSCDPNTTGPEVVYQFYASTAGMYTFELTGLAADLDLIVVSGDFSTCDPTNACVAQSVTAGAANESVSFMAKASQYYYIAVDGKGGAVSSFNLKMTSASCPPVSCYNGANRLDCTYLEDTRRNDDPLRSKNAIDAWQCDADTTGPEVVYKFDPTASGMYTVELDGLTADLDLILVSDTSGFACNSSKTCETASVNTGTASESITFQADAAKFYYIAVDGKGGAVGSYHLKVSSASCGPPVCTNSFRTLSCGVPSVSHRNDGTGATSNVSSWQCASGMTGPEVAHLFTPTGPGPYTVEMIGLKEDLDMFVIEATGTANLCSVGSSCLQSATASGATSEKLTFTADPAKRYFIVVDGKAGAISKYILAISDGCP